MTSSVRFKSIVNTTGAALTAAGIPAGDGDDKQWKVYYRVLAAADIGNGAGQTQDNPGALVVQLPSNLTVNAIIGTTYRAGRMMDSMSDGTAAHIANISYINTNGAITVYDQGNNAGVQLEAGDIVIVRVITGPAVSGN